MYNVLSAVRTILTLNIPLLKLIGCNDISTIHFHYSETVHEYITRVPGCLTCTHSVSLQVSVHSVCTGIALKHIFLID